MLKRFELFKSKNLIKRISVLTMASLIVFNSSLSYVFGEPNNNDDINVAQLRQAIETRLSQFNCDDVSSYSGELGALYNAKRIISQSIWTEFINSPKGQALHIDTSVKKYQNQQMVEVLKHFNEAYGGVAGGNSDEKNTHKDNFQTVTLDKADVDSGNFYTYQIAMDLANYINKLLDNWLSQYKHNKEELVNAKRVELRYIYNIVNSPIDDVKAINALLPQVSKTNSNGVTEFVKEPYSIGDACKKLTDIMQATDKSQVIRMAQEIKTDEMSDISVDNIDSNLNLLDRFYVGGSQNSKKLINSYYLLVAASSTYEPFVSHLGDEYFKKGLLKVSGESDKTGPLWDLYNQANMYKKPLYIRDINSSGKPSGTATRVTLSKFIDSVLNDGDGALVMPKGLIVKGKDSNSYNIYSTTRYKLTNEDSEKNKNASKSSSTPQTGDNTQQNSNGGQQTPQAGITGGDSNKEGNGDNLNVTLTGNAPRPEAPEDNAQQNLNNYLEQNQLNTTGQQNPGQGQQPAQGQQGTQQPQQNPASKGSDKKVEESLENTEFVPDGNPIASEDKLTPPVFTWGKFSFSKQLFMGTVVMTNILKDVTHLEDFKKNNEMLFMNPFGDIVTENDVVVLPAACNPTFFGESKTFYPYSIGFIKPYPNLKANENVFKVGKVDEGKYVLSVKKVDGKNLDGSKEKEEPKSKDKNKTEIKDEKPKDGDDDEKPVAFSGSKLKQGNDIEVLISQVASETNLNIRRDFKTKSFIQANMRDMGSGNTSMFRFKNYRFKGKGIMGKIRSFFNNSTSLSGYTKECYMAKIPADVISEGQAVSLFEADLKDLTDQDLGMITSNFYWGIMADGDGNMGRPNSNLNTDLFSSYILPEGLNGVNNTQVYTKNMIGDYNKRVEEGTNFITNVIRKLVKSVVSPCSNVTGVLGVEGAYQDEMLGRLTVYGKMFMPYIMVFCVFLVLIRLVTKQLNLLQAGLSSLILIICATVYTTYLPVWVPTLFNALNNNISRSLSYDTLMMKAENYEKVYSDNKDSHGNTLMSTVSINLAKLRDDDLDYLCSKLDFSKDELASGKARVINYEAGIFLQGNILRCNVDKLLKNQPIVGSYVSDKKGGVTYQIKAKKMVSSQLDYYMPYHLIVNSFVNRLNDFSAVYDLSRSTLRYPNMVKDSFMVSSYMDSALFLVPGDWKKTLEEEDTPPHIISDLQNKFDNIKDNKDPFDFLGLRTFLKKLPKEGKETLWYKTMVQNGWVLDENIKSSSGDKITQQEADDNLNELIYYVNRQTKNFMLNHLHIFKGMSDENVIKIVSLYATTMFDQKVGTFGNELYPMYINYEELPLSDVLLASYVTDSNRFISSNLDAVNYIFQVYGWFMVILFGAAALSTGLFIIICKLLVPVLYLMLGLIFIFRFVTDNDIRPVMKGYGKCCGIVLLCYSLNCLLLCALPKLHLGAWSILLQLIISSVLLETLLRLCFAILSNINEMGNSRMSMVAPAAIQKLGDLTISGAITNMKYKGLRDKGLASRYAKNQYSKFKQGRPFDDLESKVMLRKKMEEYKKEQETRDRMRNNLD